MAEQALRGILARVPVARSDSRRSWRQAAALVACGLLALTPAAPRAQDPATEGVLVLAHGGRPEWNDRVKVLVARVNERRPADVAFGMASRPAMQAAIDRLVSRGVTRVVAVPLFVSSHSSVITSTEYLLGLRREAPPELKLLAQMDHGSHGAGADAGAADANPTSPVKTSVPLRMTTALDRHPVVAEIAVTRARALSRDPSREAVVLVAHGPSRDAENVLWLQDMAVTAARVRAAAPFRNVDYLTVRDDAPKAIRDAATGELRALVTRRAREGARVLIVPLVLSYGGIEQGIRKRLDGLDVAVADRGLMPDDRLIDWVLSMAASR